jgi:glycerophosphoryl diester phosphodiesterase
MKSFAAFFALLMPAAIAADIPILPRISAHRGASHAAPENTLAAFQLAWQEGADAIEGDFHLTADGKVVCIHDADTKRTAGIRHVIAETAWDDLKTLDVGSWKGAEFSDERIPQLADVLDVLAPGKFFYLEIKSSPLIVEPIARILAEKKVDPAQVILISFDPQVISECRKKIPAFQAHLISSLKDFDLSGKPEVYAAVLKECGAQGLHFDARSEVTPDWLNQLKASGLSLTAWTADDATLARKMISFGVDTLATNRPGPLRIQLTEVEKPHPEKR